MKGRKGKEKEGILIKNLNTSCVINGMDKNCKVLKKKIKFIHTQNRNVLSTYYMPGTRMGLFSIYYR